LLDYEPLGFGEPISKDNIGPRKVALFRTEQMIRIIRDCMLMCWFCTWSPLQLSEIINAVTGWNTSIAELYRIAERVLAMTRIFNYREGFTSDDDVLPSRFFKPKTGGALSETALDPSTMDQAKRYYYKLMGWDDSSGRPLNEKLEELDLEWINL
jgi:aldehyde:ferredoxin oxidoreductase